ncbi:MAG: VpaChn25_0724 family phage protein [Caulobacteraceae bacterium]
MADIATEHRRLTILRLLAGAGGYTANSAIVHSALHEFGFAASRDLVRTDLAWLAEQECIRNADAGGLAVATLTDRGLDVARGHAIVPGIQRPSPGS